MSAFDPKRTRGFSAGVGQLRLVRTRSARRLQRLGSDWRCRDLELVWYFPARPLVGFEARIECQDRLPELPLYVCAIGGLADITLSGRVNQFCMVLEGRPLLIRSDMLSNGTDRLQ